MGNEKKGIAAIVFIAIFLVIFFSQQNSANTITPGAGVNKKSLMQMGCPKQKSCPRISGMATEWDNFIEPTADDEHVVQKCPAPTTAAGEKKDCTWKFVKYIPSALEDKWWNEIDSIQENPCQALNREPWKGLFEPYRKAIADNTMTADQPPSRASCKCDQNKEPAKYDDATFSRFEYENTCSGEKKYTYIEPLAGLLRHPDTCNINGPIEGSAHNGNAIVRKDWMIVDQWALHKNDDGVAKKKNFYFDAGASTWKSGGGGASQSWFDAIYAQRCLDFDGFWMWDAKTWDPVRIYKELPKRVRPKYHWYNIPASKDQNEGDSPLFHLKAQASEEDFVLFKLDIDTNEIENAIVEALLADPTLMNLVDEFFWEHHINMQPMSGCCWGQQAASETQKKSIGMFKKLREHGVRAHSWV